MAVVLESVATASSATVGKPTGLAVGDLMVAHLACSHSGGSALDNYSKTGWTLIAGAQSASGSAVHRATTLFRVADADDVAASDFAFTEDADALSRCGAIYRFSGAASGGAADPDGVADDDPTTTDSHTFTNSLTPAFANCIMLHLVSGVSNGGFDWATHAITTDNPTWTEQYDIDDTGAAGDGDTSMSGASASRPQTTATGNSTAASSVSITDSVGILVAVYPTASVTVSPSVITATFSVQAPTVTGDANVSPTVVTMTATVQAPTVTISVPDWNNPDKSSASFTNTSKNSASWTNPNKNSSSWSNENKTP